MSTPSTQTLTTTITTMPTTAPSPTTDASTSFHIMPKNSTPSTPEASATTAPLGQARDIERLLQEIEEAYPFANTEDGSLVT